MSNSLQPHRLYSPWNSPGQDTGVGSLSLLQGIFPTQGLNPGLLHCRQILYQLSYQVCFISAAGNWGRGEGGHLSKGRLSPSSLNPQATCGARAFIYRVWGWGLHAETAVISDSRLETGHRWSAQRHLVWGPVNLQFQGPFVPISLRPVLRIVAARVLGTVWSSYS